MARRTPANLGKSKGKANGNIMSFFKKSGSNTGITSDSQENEESLFLDSDANEGTLQGLVQTPTPPHDTPPETFESQDMPLSIPSPSLRYNEDNAPSKRRRLSAETGDRKDESLQSVKHIPRGPFYDDSDDETEAAGLLREDGIVERRDSTANGIESAPHEILSAAVTVPLKEPDLSVKVPHLKQEETSIAAADDFEGIEDFIDDEFPEEGEEFMERRWMEEQAQMEVDMEQEDDNIGGTTSEHLNTRNDDSSAVQPQDAAASVCPLCSGSTAGMGDEQISVHVNECLDGRAVPLQKQQPMPKEEPNGEDRPSVKPSAPVPGYKRFQRAAIARPGQDNPFSLTESQGKSGSAFSKLMSGHAEDNAWATAAASELSSRGKPAYQRTCPFYKIMPGFFICVDAFRYGAVEGCKAYFLSHFHSDHYIGLTSSWCHGPIYCSHVTANLVRRQLRVDPKWVVDLEFEAKVEVPNTQGVDVTMIPANHCPGSSLFLFEKVIGKGKNPKVQRVLHCGDFRACPAHVQHPKLRPDIVDQVSGKLAQQKLDVCYLDTTYLTPKYAFPSQADVIKACADMCVSLSKDFVDETDQWEQVKKERAGEGMVKFVRKSSIKEEASVKDEAPVKEENFGGDGVHIKTEDIPSETPSKKEISPPKKARGRLLVIVGTYSIGKERICLGVAKALNSKIYAPPNKQKVVAALEDAELSCRMTNDPLEAQVHMQMLMEIRAETLADYLTGYKPHFSRIVGFRPSGWNYRPPNSRFTESPSVQTVLHSDNWKSRYSMAELMPQRGSTRESSCFGVPYSEHSSFRELTMFCCALRIDKIIPTVDVGSAKSRERMKGWCEKWAMERKKNGLFKVADGQDAW